MQIILLSDVSGIGKKSDIKNVAEGHARNFLIPRGLAAEATPTRVKSVLTEKTRQEGEQKIQKDLLAKNLAALESITLTVVATANEKGHLFKGIHALDIAAAIKAQTRIDIPPEAIELPNPIKEIGEHEIAVSSGAKKATFKLLVQPTN